MTARKKSIYSVGEEFGEDVGDIEGALLLFVGYIILPFQSKVLSSSLHRPL